MNQQAVTNLSSIDYIKFLEDHPDYLAECSEMLTEAAKACKERMGESTITLKISLKPAKGGEVVQVTPCDPQLKVAKGDWASKPYFVTEKGQLLRDHPGQLGLFESKEEEPVVDMGE